MVQGEWDAIRKAYSFLDHHNALNSLCKPSTDDSNHTRDPSETHATKKARRDKSPEAPVATSTPVSALSYTPSHKYKLSQASLLQACGSPAAGMRVLGSASIVDDIAQLRSESTMAAAATARSSPPASDGSGVASHNKPASVSLGRVNAPPQGKSGAMKRKQGMPRKQLQNIGTSSVTACPAHSDEEDMLDPATEADVKGRGGVTLHAQDPPAFANGDSSIQIVAAWGNFKEEAILGDVTSQPKQEATSSASEEESTSRNRFVYYPQEKSGLKISAPGTGVYAVQSDGQGGTVILPTVTEPVYVLNVSGDRADHSSNEETMIEFTNESQYHSSSDKEEGKWSSSKQSPNGKNLTAKKSTSNRLAARKATSQRTLLLLSKKISPQPGQKVVSSGKKGGKLSPQRRRGIIQGDSPVKGEFTCSYCQKIFNTKEAIHVHEEVYHTGRYKSLPSSSKSPLFECTQCGKSYMSKHALEEHLYTHVGMRPFACPYCAASFNHRKSLRRHVQLHNNVKRFDCPQCSKTFVRKDALESHLRVHKTEEDTSSNDVNWATASDSPGSLKLILN